MVGDNEMSRATVRIVVELCSVVLLAVIAAVVTTKTGRASQGPDESAQSAPAIAISWSTVDAGGTTANGGNLTLEGTAGQAEPEVAAGGGALELSGGFWSMDPITDAAIFADGFESADVSNWSSSVP